MMKSKKYTFLMCSERSGSNFITKIMNNHSQICGPATKHLINPLVRNYFRYMPIEQPKNWNELLEDLLNLYNVSFSLWRSEFNLDKLKKNISLGDISGLIDYFFTTEMLANNKQHLFIKEIKLFEFYPFLKKYFNEASYIYLVRDPRDMALSWKKSSIHFGGVVGAARQWKEDQQQYLKIHYLEGNNSFLLKYEDLVSDLASLSKEILCLLGFGFEKEMLSIEKDDLTKENAKKQKAWENLSNPVMTDNFNKFKEELSVEEIKFIEAICFFEMTHLGYKRQYSWEELKDISNHEINDFHTKETQNINYNVSKSVLDNMNAKQKFYQRLTSK